MSELEVGLGGGWTARVEETFQALKWADRDVQEQACQSIEKERDGREEGKKLRELFEAEADRMKAGFFTKPCGTT
jgi:hypothetical protein